MVRLACSSKGRRDSHRRSRAWRHSEVEDACAYISPKMRHELTGQIPLNGGEHVCAPTTVSPSVEDCPNARDRLGKEHGLGGSQLSAQSQRLELWKGEWRAKGELAAD